MDLTFVGNALLFLAALGVQLGALDSGQTESASSTSAAAAETDTTTEEVEIVPIELAEKDADADDTEPSIDKDEQTSGGSSTTGASPETTVTAAQDTVGDPVADMPGLDVSDTAPGEMVLTDPPAGGDPDPATAYVPGDYALETRGTDGDDTLGDPFGPSSVAYFLQGGNDALDATPGNDFADGGPGDDSLRLRLGDDMALGGEGDDTIDGGIGDDTLSGGDGDDSITGNKDDDLLLGGAGNDTLTGSLGDDSIEGGDDDDQLFGDLAALQGQRADGMDTLSGGAGDDSLHVGGGDQAEGGEGADSFFLYDPADTGPSGQITDFDPAEDMIGVVYTQQTDPVTGDPVDPVVTVAPNDDGTGAILYLDGVEVGRVAGGQSLTADDIALIPN